MKAGRFILRKMRWLIDTARKRLFDLITGPHYVAALRKTPRSAKRSGEIYVDISVICQNDAATGIQRVVRSVAFLLAEPPSAFAPRPIFIYASKGQHYIVELDGGAYHLTDIRVEYAAGDIFVGLDYALDVLWRMRRELAHMRRNGVHFWYVVHDFLPLTNPDWFSRPTVLRFRIWLAIIAATADGFFCVSSPVESQLRAILEERFGIRDGYKTVVIPMGWDLATLNPSMGLPDGFEAAWMRMQATPSVLMVGTIEPRKGHAAALAAMERLWAQGVDVNLVIVGGVGWKTEALCTYFENHMEFGRRLFIMGKVSDEALERLYAICSGVLAPSLAEGFGLPVVEAIGRGKRVLARDLAVFAQHANKGVTYFPATADAATLAQAIQDWLARLEELPPPRPDLLPTWRDTACVIYANTALDGLEHSGLQMPTRAQSAGTINSQQIN